MNVVLNPLYLGVVAALLPIYWLLLSHPGKRLLLITAASTAALYYIEPYFILWLAGMAYSAAVLSRLHWLGRIGAFGTGLIIVLSGIAVLGVCKYGVVVLGHFFDHTNWIERYLIVPLGISYFALRLVGYVFEQLRGRIAETSGWKLYAYFTFFPLIPAGPLETYSGFYSKREPDFDRHLFNLSARRICRGYFKKLVVLELLLNQAFSTWDAIFLDPAASLADVHPLAPWGFAIASFLRAYIDISAYTDIAIGVAGLFGFRIVEDLNNPVFKPNLAAFWQSWHISVMNWCRDNVYFPIFGATRVVPAGLFASLSVMGLWHYVNLNWFVWGIYQATGLTTLHYWNRYKLSHKQLRKRLNSPQYKPLGYIATFLFASLAFTIMAPYPFTRAVEVFSACLFGPARWILGS